jgi:RHH-type rel operon transcriptional repressor/antitoxin RelB
MIEQGIEEMEDHYLAADVLERVRNGKEQVHSAADVIGDLGLARREKR